MIEESKQWNNILQNDFIPKIEIKKKDNKSIDILSYIFISKYQYLIITIGKYRYK